jgi:integrase
MILSYEVVNLRIDDIDGKRMVIWVRNTKGHRDRSVPLRHSSESVASSHRRFFQTLNLSALHALYPSFGVSSDRLTK